MCILYLCVGAKPSAGELLIANQLNPHGIGIAYIDAGKVQFKKGLSIDHLISILDDLKLPLMMHFRFATSGGRHDHLCHPFPIDTVETAFCRGLTGSANAVIAHNGVFDKVFSDFSLLKSLKRRYNGNYSDTQLIAAMSAINCDYLGAVDGDNKIAKLSGDGHYRLFGRWFFQDGIFRSNEEALEFSSQSGLQWDYCDVCCELSESLQNGICDTCASKAVSQDQPDLSYFNHCDWCGAIANENDRSLCRQCQSLSQFSGLKI